METNLNRLSKAELGEMGYGLCWQSSLSNVCFDLASYQNEAVAGWGVDRATKCETHKKNAVQRLLPCIPYIELIYPDILSLSLSLSYYVHMHISCVNANIWIAAAAAVGGIGGGGKGGAWQWQAVFDLWSSSWATQPKLRWVGYQRQRWVQSGHIKNACTIA